MAKWADYGIFSVRYNAKHTHIDRVKAMADDGEKFAASNEWDRATVIAAIKNNTTFVTIIKTADGKWSKGQPVYIIKVNGTEYIKTVDNGKEADNLENLPEF